MSKVSQAKRKILQHFLILKFKLFRETSGVLDLDSELELYFSGLGKVKFEFTSGSDIVTLGKLISEKIL